MHDLPTGPALLAFACEVLLNELTPLLPEDRRQDALLVAKCMAIAEREAETGGEPLQAVLRELEMLYEEESRCLLHRFARDLRTGAFEGSELRERIARVVMWRLTIAKLRRSNPSFLAANGLR
jgi:hypothetical protein